MGYKPGEETGLYIGKSKAWLTDWRTTIGKHGVTKKPMESRVKKRAKRKAAKAAKRGKK